MKFLLMPHEPTWWVWLTTECALIVGLAGIELGFVTAVAVSVAQSAYFWTRDRSWGSFPLQIRVAYAALLLVSFLPAMRWLYWLPAVGTLALLVFGYCLMARFLSVMPWNRSEAITLRQLFQTFLTPPVLGWATHGLPASGCPDVSRFGTPR